MLEIVTIPSKSVQLANIIRGEIAAGKIRPGERLLPIRAMATKFGVTQQVAQTAFGILRQEKLVESNSGRGGTYVAEARKTLISQTVLSIIETKQEDHAEFIAELPEMLAHEHYVPSVYELNSSIKLKERIRKLIKDVPKAVIIDGTGLVPYDILDDIAPETHLVFINRFEGKKKYDASYILSDYVAGGYTAVRHLLGIGRKKIMIMTNEIKPGWTSDLFMKGCIKALDEAGLKPAAVLNNNAPEVGEQIEEIFSSKHKPDGVAALADSHFIRIKKCLKKFKLKIPEDVALIGYHNTPWAEALDLTSLSIRADFISEKAVEAIETGEKINLNVKPELVFRNSCPESSSGNLPEYFSLAF